MNGGEIDFVFTANTDQLKNVFNDTEKGILGFSDIVAKAGNKIDSVFDITKENIKIQKEVITELESKYKDLSKAIEDIAPGKAKLTMMKEAASIKAEIEAEKKSLIELESSVKSTETTYKSFESKLNAVKNEMKDLEAAGQQNSSRYVELSQKALEYQNANDRVNKSIAALKNNAGLTALVESVGLASGAFSTYQGIVALVGGENENLEKIMTRVQAAMAITVGIQQIQNSLGKESSLMQSIYAIKTLAKAKAEEIAAVSTGKATIAQRAFNLVANANPYVLLATALITVVGALVLFSGKTKKAIEDQNKLNKAIADNAANSIISYKQLQISWNSLGNDLKSQKKFITDNKDEFHELGVEVKNVTEAEKFFKSGADSFVKSLMLRAEAAAYAQVAVEKYKEAILKDKDIEQFDKDWKNAGFFGKIGLGVKAIYNNIDDKAGEKARKEAEKGLLKEAELLKKADELRKNAANEYVPEDKKKKTAKKKADEYLPPGSVAEIQKRLSEIDKALSKATTDNQRSELKAKRISTALELAEAEKLIQIKTLQEQFDESEKLWQQYYNTIESIDKETADKIYGDLLKNDKSSYDALIKQRDDLKNKANLTDEERNYFSFIDEKINSMLGKQSRLETFKQTIEETLSTLGTDAEKLKFLDEQKTTANKSTGEYAIIEDYNRKILESAKQRYQEFLAAHQSFEERRNSITENYATLRQKIEADASLKMSKRKTLLKKQDKRKLMLILMLL